MNRRQLLGALVATPAGVALGQANLTRFVTCYENNRLRLTLKVPALTAIQYWGKTFPGEILLNGQQLRVQGVEVVAERDELVFTLEPA